MANMVKSVEFIEYTATSTTNQVNLTQNQDHSNCVPFLTLHGADDNQYSHLHDVYFSGTTESGIINFDRAVAGSNKHIKCYVVEFESTEVRVQQGSFGPLTAGVLTEYTTASGFDPTKSAMVHYWSNTTSTTSWNHHLVRGSVDTVSGTHVDFRREGANGTIAGHYFLFEDISATNEHFSVNHLKGSTTAANSIQQIPEGRGDPSRTIVIGSWSSNHTHLTDNDKQTIRIFYYLRNASYWDRANSAEGTIWWSVQQFTFNDDSKMYVGFNHWTSMSSTTTISTNAFTRAIDIDEACVVSTSPFGICRGNSTGSAGTTQLDSLWMSIKHINTTQVQFQRNSPGGNQTSYWGYAVVNWNGEAVDTGTNSNPLDKDMTFVKSVENFRISIETYYAERDLTKGQVVDNCALFCSTRGNSTGSDELRQSSASIWLRDSGTVVAHNMDASGQTYVDVSVVEFYPDQVKVQQGEWTMWGTTTENATIEAVNRDRAFILTKWEVNEPTRWDRIAVRTRFTSDTDVEFYRVNSGNYTFGNFFVVEDLGDNFRTEHSISNTIGSTLSHWTDNFYLYYRDWMIGSYATAVTNDDVNDGTARIYYTGNGSRFIINKAGITDALYGSFTSVKMIRADRNYTSFIAPYLSTGTSTFTGAISSNFTGHEDALTIFNAMQNSVGRGSTTDATGGRSTFHTARLINNNTEYEISRESSSHNTYPSYTVLIDWIGYVHPSADDKGVIPRATETASLVRSMEQLIYTGTSRLLTYYLTKGQRPENCVPFHTWRAGASDGLGDRLYRWVYISSDLKVTTHSNSAGLNGNLDELVTIIEFNPAQVKVQKVVDTMTGTSLNIAIEEVDLTKAFLTFGYSTDNGSTVVRYGTVAGEFSSSTQLTFTRAASSAGVYIVAYVVECLQDQWVVNHSTNGSATATSFTDGPFDFRDDGFKGRFILGSYASNVSNDDCDSSLFRLYFRGDSRYTWDKQNAVDATTRRNIEVIEFNKNLKIRIGGYWSSLTGTEISETQSIFMDDALDLDRSMVCPTIDIGLSRVNTTSIGGIGASCIKYEFADSGSVTASRYNWGSFNTYGFYQWIEWPAYKTHYFEGYITERGVPIIRNVSCFRTDTHELMDYTTSSGDGSYRLETSYSGSHYIICQDDDLAIDYNDLILGKMEPQLIPYWE